jgi:hypothetical protein
LLGEIFSSVINAVNSLGTIWRGGLTSMLKSRCTINEERKVKHCREHEILTWKTLATHKRKTMGASQQNFTISVVFTNVVGVQ